jgi:arabinosaccharide transport system substrate-binding protein
MIEGFPYGKAPFWLMALAFATTLAVLATQRWGKEGEPDLTLATFAANHMTAYQERVPAFERKHGVKISLQLVQRRALQTRLQNAMLAGTAVPDLAELAENDIAFFTRGPLSDVGFLDLTDRILREGFRERLVEERLSLWQSQKRVFAIPHDVHPVMLAYRADILAELGIDPDAIRTWDDFVALRSKVVKDLDGDGVVDRYLVDLPIAESWGLQILLLQRGVSLFDVEGNLAFNRKETIDTIFWYIHQVEGKERIATQCGWGQPLAKAQKDGRAVFFIAPDWRTGVMELEAPAAKGLFKVMPLPAWTPGGRRTAVWGGSGLAITRASKRPDLAWELAKALYFDPAHLGQRFLLTNIIPPLKDSWKLPEFHEPNAYFRGQAIGAEFAKLATEVPPNYGTPYSLRASDRLADVFLKSLDHFRKHGDAGLREAITRELQMVSDDLAAFMGRNVLAKR